MNAMERWQRLQAKRHAVLERARDCAAVTVPALVPPEGHNDSNTLPTPYQSLGARGVNNLASKILLALLPPGTSFFRLAVPPKIRRELEAAGRDPTAIEQQLAIIEQAVSTKLEVESVRPILFEAIKHLVVSGNALLHLPDEGMRLYRLDQFVVDRDPDGNPLEAIVKQQVSPRALPAEVCAQCALDPEKMDEPHDLYTHIQWINGRVLEYQEINGRVVPGSEGTRPLAKTEWIVLRWQAVPGQNYGRGLAEEYLGDLRSLEGLTESVVAFSAVASKVVFFTKPGAITKWKDITKAKSGEAVKGNRDDVTVLQLDKYADFQVAKAVIDDLTLRLSHAFLLRSGTVRNAERVTAEEIRGMAQELEDVLGGVYTVLAQELQLPLVARLMARMQAKGEIPVLPKDTVQPMIITGFEALGRNHSVNRLRFWLADLAQTAPAALQELDQAAVARRLGVGHGVEDLSSLFKTPEQKQAEQQQQAAAMVADKAAGPIAQAVGKQAAGQ